jgi:hypothetical protein
MHREDRRHKEESYATIRFAMYAEVRLALVAIAAAIALLSGWFAAQAIRSNLVVLRTWEHAEGELDGEGPKGTMEIVIGERPDTRRLLAPMQHYRGLSRIVTVYLDPADPERARIGGALQLWLWPATAILLCLLGCAGMLGAFRAGRGATADAAANTSWRLSPQPAADRGDIVVHAPKSEGVAPLYWSLLGVAALATGIFAPWGTPYQRLGPILLGSFFMLGTWGLALHGRTLRVSASGQGLRETSALGWRQVPWERVRSVERRDVVSVAYQFTMRERLAFPGNRARTIVFADDYGFALLRMSEHMQPSAAVQRLFDLCEQRTGLQLKFRHMNVAPF